MEDYLTAEEALILTKKAQKKICKMKLPEILDEVKNAAMDGNVRVSIEGKVRPYINWDIHYGYGKECQMMNSILRLVGILMKTKFQRRANYVNISTSTCRMP